MAAGSSATPSASTTPTDPASSGSSRPAPGIHGGGPAAADAEPNAEPDAEPDPEPSGTPIFDALCAELGDPTDPPVAS
jgi:hypothetical protein